MFYFLLIPHILLCLHNHLLMGMCVSGHQDGYKVLCAATRVPVTKGAQCSDLPHSLSSLRPLGILRPSALGAAGGKLGSDLMSSPTPHHRAHL